MKKEVVKGNTMQSRPTSRLEGDKVVKLVLLELLKVLFPRVHQEAPLKGSLWEEQAACTGETEFK